MHFEEKVKLSGKKVNLHFTKKTFLTMLFVARVEKKEKSRKHSFRLFLLK